MDRHRVAHHGIVFVYGYAAIADSARRIVGQPLVHGLHGYGILLEGIDDGSDAGFIGGGKGETEVEHVE